MKRTLALVEVAMVLLADPDGRHYGYETGKKTGLRSGVLYPIFTRLLEDGWVDSAWEDPDDNLKRPPRRYYTLTDQGKTELRALVASAKVDRRFAAKHGSTLGWAAKLRWAR